MTTDSSWHTLLGRSYLSLVKSDAYFRFPGREILYFRARDALGSRA